MLPDPGSRSGQYTSQNVLTIVSKPAHPDNSHQTIIQPSSPPELKITTDLRLPNIILGKPIEAPKAPLQFNPSAAKPNQKNRKTNAEPAPRIKPENSANARDDFPHPSQFQALMAVAVASGRPA